MKLKLITAVSDNTHPGFIKLSETLNRHGWDWMVIHNPSINWDWGGLWYIWNWCHSPEAEGYTHFLYTDGFDTLALGGPDELSYKDYDSILYSGEKNCYPRFDWIEQHTSTDRWKFLNHGQFIAPIELYKWFYAGKFNLPLTCQEWAMEKYLNDNDGRLKIDSKCEVFQSVAFESPDEFSNKKGRIFNNITKTKPLFVHFNGRTDTGSYDKLMGV